MYTPPKMFKIERPSGSIELTLPQPSFYIYKITNNVNGKKYIGSTNNPARRIEEHLSGKGSQPLLTELVEYGRKDFSFNIIDMLATDDKQAVFDLEDSYIEKYDAIASGYNCRLNRVPTADSDVDLSSFTVRGKYTYANSFTVGMNSRYLSYQTLLSAYKKIGTNPPCMTFKSKAGHPYVSLTVSGIEREDCIPDGIYTLNLEYKNGKVHLI
jgi:hypothetical protein